MCLVVVVEVYMNNVPIKKRKQVKFKKKKKGNQVNSNRFGNIGYDTITRYKKIIKI